MFSNWNVVDSIWKLGPFIKNSIWTVFFHFGNISFCLLTSLATRCEFVSIVIVTAEVVHEPSSHYNFQLYKLQLGAHRKSVNEIYFCPFDPECVCHTHMVYKVAVTEWSCYVLIRSNTVVEEKRFPEKCAMRVVKPCISFSSSYCFQCFHLSLK